MDNHKKESVKKACVKREWLDAKYLVKNEKEQLKADIWIKPGSVFGRRFWEEVKDELIKNGFVIRMESPGAFLVIRPEIIHVISDVALPLAVTIIADRILKWYDELQERKERSEPKTLCLEVLIHNGTKVQKVEISGDANSVIDALRELTA